MMDSRLKTLRKSMKKTAFHDLNFTEHLRNRITGEIQQNISKEQVLLAVLQLLVSRKTGFDLNQSLRSRGIWTFTDREGELYIMLHELEAKQWLHSTWQEEYGKYYQLSDKGRKQLNHLENDAAATSIQWKEQPEGK